MVCPLLRSLIALVLGTTASVGRGVAAEAAAAAESAAGDVIPTFAPTFGASFPTASPTIDCGGGFDCPSTTMCCKTLSNQWGCCAMADGVCCSDHVHCCPKSHPVCGGTPAKPTCATNSGGNTLVAEWGIAARRTADDGAAAPGRGAAAAVAAAAPATAPVGDTMDALGARLGVDAASRHIARLRLEALANVDARRRARHVAKRNATRAAKRARRA